jgi:primosomal protein N' (replication factor Y)
LDNDVPAFADVAFNGPGPLERTTFTYLIPEHLRGRIQRGHLVVVPFRQGRLPGLVVSLSKEAPNFPVREIESIFPQEPIIPPHGIALAQWISLRYLAPLPVVLRLFLPAGRRFRVMHAYVAAGDREPADLTRTEAMLLATLKSKGPLTPKSLATDLSEGTVKRHIRALLSRGLVERIVVPDIAQDLLARSERKDATGALLRASNPDPDDGQASSSDLSAADHMSARAQEAWEQLRKRLAGNVGRPLALYGLSPSERLSIYVRLLRPLARQRKGGLLLLPEIREAEAAVRLLTDSLGMSVAVVHSRLSTNRLEKEWLKVWSGEATVAVGTRIAVFAPVHRLSFIVVDEESDDSYKSPQTVSYNAREVALELSRLTGASLIFCSSVPSMWLQAAARRGDIYMLPPPLVPPDSAPSVEVIDLRRTARNNRPLITQPFLNSLRATVGAGQQAVVVLNRRGLASSVVCRKCGARVSCRRCEGPMTYHQEPDLLVCHRCGQRQRMPGFCEVCGAKDFRLLGVGTERVTRDLQQLMPHERILRLDRDSAPDASTQRRMIRSFWRGEWSILVGTSLALEALEAPAVSLAALLIPDVALHLPDIDAAERIFQTISQLSLWQRLRPKARVLVETYSPEHHAIRCALRADPRCFYAAEAPFRSSRGYPPFGEFIRLLYTSSSEATCERQSRTMYEHLQALAREHNFKVDIWGPAPAYWQKLAGKYRWHILVKGQNALELVSQANIHRGWHIDVDPVTIL